jgi:hypothetical protein
MIYATRQARLLAFIIYVTGQARLLCRLYDLRHRASLLVSLAHVSSSPSLQFDSLPSWARLKKLYAIAVAAFILYLSLNESTCEDELNNTPFDLREYYLAEEEQGQAIRLDS